jgi:hypothetical protein
MVAHRRDRGAKRVAMTHQPVESGRGAAFTPQPSAEPRRLWLDLGWLFVLILTFGTTLSLDALGVLNYAWSLLLWAIPIAYLVPLFATVTSQGTGRRRKALALCIAMIVGLGIVLDFLLGHLTLIFPGCEIEGKYLHCIRGEVPVEELMFYALGPAAMVLAYACADERWLAAYNPPDDLLDLKLLQISRPIAMTAVVTAVALLAVWQIRGAFPIYATFLAAGALLPALVLYRAVGGLVNWPAYAVTTLYVALTSVVWEATLALPREWWGYNMTGMLAQIDAWSTPHPFPLEAAFVWIVAPFSCVLTYEFAKAFMHHPSPSTRDALLGGRDHAVRIPPHRTR